ncbi:MAG: metalloregulator ArsR/SmtB family transcription factor [Vicinamibacterales bacterium]
MSSRRGRHTRSSPSAFTAAAPVFAALGDPTRLHLVTRLCREGPLPIVSLTEETALTRQAVTKHLQILASAGLATVERRGREQRWRVDEKCLAETRQLLQRISAQWDDALDRLARFVERDDR